MFKRQVYDPPVPSTTHTHAPPVPDTRTAPLPISSVMDAILDTGAAAAASPGEPTDEVVSPTPTAALNEGWLSTCNKSDLQDYDAILSRTGNRKKRETLVGGITTKCLQKIADPVSRFLAAGFPGENEDNEVANFRSYFTS